MKRTRLAPASLPDKSGHFGRFGGRFVPETLMSPLLELERAYLAARRDAGFRRRLRDLLRNYAGRPTPLYFAERLTRHAGGARIYLKREDLCHTGAHKINNVLGQALLAQRMRKTRIIAETGAGQHGVASATAAALLGLPCEVADGVIVGSAIVSLIERHVGSSELVPRVGDFIAALKAPLRRSVS